MEVTLPLSPKLCALLTHPLNPDYIDIDTATVDELNMRCLYRCRDIFLSETPSRCVEWLEES